MAHQHEDAEADGARAFDMDEAAAALNDFISDEDDPKEASEDDDDIELEDDLEGDEPTDEDDSEDEDDEDDEPETAIEAPASLKAEEKEAFSQLPKEAQQFVRQFATRRDSEIQQGLEQARTAQRNAESSAAQQVAEATQAHAEQLMAVAQATAPQMPGDELLATNPQAYLQAKARYDREKAQHDQFVQQIHAMHEGARQELDQAEQQAIQAEWREVITDLPEAKDPQQWKALLEELTPFAKNLGYTDEQIASARPRDIRMVKRFRATQDKADKYDALMARKMERVRSGKTAKSNAAQPKGSGQRKARMKTRERLRNTGSIDDAAAAIANLS